MREVSQPIADHKQKRRLLFFRFFFCGAEMQPRR